ncbi:Oidioi.mRNA.OKI2018_I69.PAR.g12596.t1.cds [Oikopleura dioica]|uniref:Oidioi.mRNA.OKI2018_I69.PAR.g12596.t1.cds n=1 Tax=Oikopleura dioica TaxID=34765 RepID=A0ABN7S195_OIKDI|nr:Oidioi.mRNA.OKI2018_I69.PAR.g12596.t1.cds [Oikopleura dioica]
MSDRERLINEDDQERIRESPELEDELETESQTRTFTDTGMETETRLERTLGLFDAVGIGVGIMLGSGIFVSPGGVMANAGSFGSSIIIWVLCGVFSLLGGLCYAELGTLIPESGGDYTYCNRIFPDIIGFLRLWVEVIIIRPGCHAAVAVTFAVHILQPFFPGQSVPSTPKKLIAAACITLFSWLNMYSIRGSTMVNSYTAFAKTISLILIIGVGIMKAAQGEIYNFMPEEFWKDSTTDFPKLCLACYSGLWSFAGWTDIVLVTEEIQNPGKNVPLSIIISCTLIIGLYCLVNLAYFTVLTRTEASAIATAQVFIEKALPTLPGHQYIIPVLVSLACFGGVNGSLFASGRYYFVAGRNNHMPPILSMVQIHRNTPSVACFLNGLLSTAMLFNDDIYSLINYTNFIYFVCIILAISGLAYLKITGQATGSTVKVPLPILILTLIMFSGVVLGAMVLTPYETLGGCILTLTGLPVYFIFVRPRGKLLEWREKIEPQYEKFSRFVQKLMVVVPETKEE